MNRALSTTAWVMSLSVGVLSACANAPDSPATQGQTPAFAEGYRDGCSSGRASQGSVFYSYQKNDARFTSDRPYAQGWSDGYQKCEALQMQANASGGGGR